MSSARVVFDPQAVVHDISNLQAVVESNSDKLNSGPMISRSNFIMINYYDLANLSEDSSQPRVLTQNEVDYLNTLSDVCNTHGSWSSINFLNNRVGATEVIEFIVFRRMEDVSKLFENFAKFISIAVERHGNRFNFGSAGSETFVVGTQNDLDTFKAYFSSYASGLTYKNFGGYPFGSLFNLTNDKYIEIEDVNGEILAYTDRMAVLYDKVRDQTNGFSQENVNYFNEFAKQALKTNVGTAQAFSLINVNVGKKYAFELIIFQSDKDHRDIFTKWGDINSKTLENLNSTTRSGIAMQSIDIIGSNAGKLENFYSDINSLPRWEDLSDQSKVFWAFIGETNWNKLTYINLFKQFGVQGFNFISLQQLPLEYRQLIIDGDKNVVDSKLKIMDLVNTPGVSLKGLNEPFKTGLYNSGEIYVLVEIIKSVQNTSDNYLDSIINQTDQNMDTIYSSLVTTKPECKYFNRSSALGRSTCIEVMVFSNLNNLKLFALNKEIYKNDLLAQYNSFYTLGYNLQCIFASDISNLESQMSETPILWNTLTVEQRASQTTLGLNETTFNAKYSNLYSYISQNFVSDSSILKFSNCLSS